MGMLLKRKRHKAENGEGAVTTTASLSAPSENGVPKTDNNTKEKVVRKARKEKAGE